MFHQHLPATFDTLWPDAILYIIYVRGHTRAVSGSPVRRWHLGLLRDVVKISAHHTHVSAAFQAAFPLVTDSGPFRSVDTWNKKVVRSILSLWRFYTFSVYAFCLPFLNRLVWFDFALLLKKKKIKKTYGSLKPINTIRQSCHCITADSLSHPTHVCTFFFPVPFMADEALMPALVIFLRNQSRQVKLKQAPSPIDNRSYAALLCFK